MYFAKSTRGFYDPSIHGSNIPADAVEISSERHAELLQGQAEGFRIEGDEFGSPVLVTPPSVPAPVPAFVTPRQARLALLSIGKLAAVLPAIDALPEPQRAEARIEWEYATTIERHAPLVELLGVALDLDLDALFLQADAF